MPLRAGAYEALLMFAWACAYPASVPEEDLSASILSKDEEPTEWVEVAGVSYCIAEQCRASFTYLPTGERVKGCTIKDSPLPWCSVDETYDPRRSSWTYCKPCIPTGPASAKVRTPSPLQDSLAVVTPVEADEDAEEEPEVAFPTVCEAPVGVGCSMTPSCAEGQYIPESGWCTPLCGCHKLPVVLTRRANPNWRCFKEGQDNWNFWGTKLCCVDGQLYPPNFVCRRDPFDEIDADNNGRINELEWHKFQLGIGQGNNRAKDVAKPNFDDEGPMQPNMLIHVYVWAVTVVCVGLACFSVGRVVVLVVKTAFPRKEVEELEQAGLQDVWKPYSTKSKSARRKKEGGIADMIGGLKIW